MFKEGRDKEKIEVKSSDFTSPTLTAVMKEFLRLVAMLMRRASLQVIMAIPAVR